MNTIPWDAVLSFVSIIVSAVVTFATYNLRMTSNTLKEVTETVKEIQINQKEHQVRLEFLEKIVEREYLRKDGDKDG